MTDENTMEPPPKIVHLNLQVFIEDFGQLFLALIFKSCNFFDYVDPRPSQVISIPESNYWAASI